MSTYSNAHAKVGFSMSSSQEFSSGLVSFKMIVEALQSEFFTFKFHSLVLKILKIPEFKYWWHLLDVAAQR